MRPMTHERALDMTYEIPGVLDFVMGKEYLDRPNLYPRQGTLLKILFLEADRMTDYDFDVIQEWEDRYLSTADDKGEGKEGISPGILKRIEINRMCPCGHDKGEHGSEERRNMSCLSCDGCPRYRGRYWFREVVAAIGRRGSKGHIGAMAGAYILWHFIQKGNPQAYYGVDRDKRLQAIVFAGKKEQAKAYQWADLNNVILGAPCFTDYLGRPQSESITLRSKYDEARESDRANRQVRTTADISSFEIIPKESTKIAGRGGAAFMLYFDEAAHVVKGAAKNDVADVHLAATPALDQFGKEGFIYLPSSPWQRTGLFYNQYLLSIAMDSRGNPEHPEMMMVQLPSWGLYEDWERSHTLKVYEDGEKMFPRMAGPIQAYDDDMKQIEKANPETFAVERRAQFASVIDAYLKPEKIAQVWEPWPGPEDVLRFVDRGNLATIYRAHGDPSKSGARFGWAIAHIAGRDERELPHVVFDVVHYWDPADFEGHEVDYDFIGGEIEKYLDAFMPAEVTFDQFSSVQTIQRLQRHAQKKRYPKRVQIYERPATSKLNWNTAEITKTAMGLGLVHSPYHEELEREMSFLQDFGGRVDKPTSGPVQTKDIWDAFSICVYELIGDEVATLMAEGLGGLKLRGSSQGGFEIPGTGTDPDGVHSALSSFGRGKRYRDRTGIGRPRPRG